MNFFVERKMPPGRKDTKLNNAFKFPCALATLWQNKMNREQDAHLSVGRTRSETQSKIDGSITIGT